MSNNYSAIQKNIKSQPFLPHLSDNELKYIKTPMGKALHNYSTKNINLEPQLVEKQKTTWADRVKCPVCNIVFTRSCRTAHNRSKIHNAYLQMDSKMKKFMFEQ